MDLQEIIIAIFSIIFGVGFCILLDKLRKSLTTYKDGEPPITELPKFTGEIFFDGRKFTEFNYRAVIPEMKEENPDFIFFHFENKFEIVVGVIDGSIDFQIRKSDGSSFSTYGSPVDVETACNYVEKLLNNEIEWMSELKWEQLEASNHETAFGCLIILISGFCFYILANWLLKMLG